MKNKSMTYFLKVMRNSFILAGLYFASVLATNNLCWETLRPILVFIIGYICTELLHYFKIAPTKFNRLPTLIF